MQNVSKLFVNSNRVSRTMFPLMTVAVMVVIGLSFTACSGGASARVIMMSAGINHTATIRADGTLWTWGANGSGRLGDGTTTDRGSPTRIGADTNWAFVSAGGNHTVAIRTDGTLWAWGGNWSGLTGLGTTEGNTLVPTQVGTDTNWASVSAGVTHTVAVRTDGTLWAWGTNEHGRLGDGTTTLRNIPAQVGTDTTWASVSAGTEHTVAVRTDGTLWAWGSNWEGALGDGTGIHRSTPVRIGVATNWASVSAGFNHTVAVRTDGTLWAYRQNHFSFPVEHHPN